MILIKIKTIQKVAPLLIFNVVFFAIFFTNFPFGKFFYGWDGLYPELNIGLNIERGVNAAWQDNYGLGVQAGHGFAATLPHTIIIGVLRLIFPIEMVRPLFTFLCLYVGGIGIYVLLNLLFAKFVSKKIVDPIGEYVPFVSVFASVFYMTNLVSVQMFALQLEAFIVQFAALPWLIWIVVRLLTEKISRKLWIYFIAINVFASIQGFIPPLFVTYLLILGIIFVGYVVSEKFSFLSIKRVLIIGIGTIAINSYWLLPFISYLLLQQGDYLNAYNNLISTPKFIEQSLKYGGFQGLVLLKSFFWEGYQLGGYVFGKFISYHRSWFVELLGLIIWFVMLVGSVVSFKISKSWLIRSLFVGNLLIFSLMATGVFPFSLLTNFLQILSPSFAQAFRITFTKFGLGLSFFYSLFFGIGLLFLLNYFRKRFPKFKFSVNFLVMVFGVLVYYSMPIFNGGFLFQKLKIEIPNSYFDTIDFFKNNPNGRIAEFPQECSEGWYTNKWGYFGSGFMWYGIENPLLSRSADVWGKANENYYWQITQALREKDFGKVDNVLDKYDVKWVTYDSSLLHCNSQKAHKHYEDFIEYLKSSSNYKLAREFESDANEQLLIFERKADVSDLRVINNDLKLFDNSFYSDQDEIYSEYGNYVASGEELIDVFYPFDYLFTKREPIIGDNLINYQSGVVDFKSKLMNIEGDYNLQIPAYKSFEYYLLTLIDARQVKGGVEVVAKYLFPEIYLNEELLLGGSKEVVLGFIPDVRIDALNVFINDEKHTLPEIIPFYTKENNIIKIFDLKGEEIFTWNSENDEYWNNLIAKKQDILVRDVKNNFFELRMPVSVDDNAFGMEVNASSVEFKIIDCDVNAFKNGSGEYKYVDDKPDDYVRISSTNNSQCAYFEADRMFSGFSYLIEVNSRNVSGNSMRMQVIDKDKIEYLDTYLSGSQDFESNYFILPESFDDRIGYEVILNNSSENYKKVVNDFSSLSIVKIPNSFIKNIRLVNLDFSEGESKDNQAKILEVSKKSNWLYKVEAQFESNQVLSLSQSYHLDWKAFYFEGIKPVFLDHVKVNEWANGWKMPNVECGMQNVENCDQLPTHSIYIIFWPQLLEYLGFGLFFGSAIWVLRIKK